MVHLFKLLGKFSPNTGIFILRLGIGIMFIMHGYPKIAGGKDIWEFLGMQMTHIGINFAPVFWGFMAAFAEFFGGILLILGLFVRPVAFMMFFTMLIASLMHINMGEGIKGSAHAIELGIVFIAILIAGAGKYSLDNFLFKKIRSELNGS